MPKLTASNPKYRMHRASGQAVVTLDGRDFYLGPHGSTASRQEYDRLIGEWLAAGRRLPRQGGGDASDLTFVELVAGFWKHAQVYYHQPAAIRGNSVRSASRWRTSSACTAAPPRASSALSL